MKKFTCDISVIDSGVHNPQECIQYEYFIRAEEAFGAILLIKEDLNLDKDSNQKIMEFYLSEDIHNQVPFPEGNGIVSKLGPTEMIKVEDEGLLSRIKKRLLS